MIARTTCDFLGVPMKHFLPLLLILATGCSTQFQPAPHGPQKDLATTPTVLFVGDNQMASWYTAGNLAQHPGWVNGGTVGQAYETSDSVLARMPQLLADHPSDVVVILAGVFDMTQTSWQPPCGQTCNNLMSMINMAQKAGSKVILCSFPDIEAGSAALRYSMPTPTSTRTRNIPTISSL